MPTSLYFGTRTAKVLKHRSGFSDDGVVYNLLAHSERVAPAGPGGECAFFLAYITTRHYDQSVAFTLAFLLDGVQIATTTISLTGSATTLGNRQTREMSLLQAYSRSAIERLRFAPRGTWIEVVVTTAYGSPPTALQLLEDVSIEYEVVRETQTADVR